MAANIISIKDVKKTFKTFEREEGLLAAFKSIVKRKHIIKEALKGISFDVEKGEILGFIGPNGAGKSTAIKAMTGVLYPDSGSINILGFIPWQNREEYVKHIGVIFGQKSQLWWDLPPVDAFYLLKEIYEVPEKLFKRRLNYMTKLLNVSDIYKTPVRNLSLGERMKCEVIAALLHNPKIVFLDEPTIGMDVIAKDTLRKFILEINKKHKTTFIVTTHDMGDIEKLCDRIIIINKGKIIYDGLLENIKKKYIKEKTISIKFLEKTGPIKLPGCKILRESPYDIKIIVLLKKRHVEDIVEYFLKNYKVADILIADPEIDEIIKQIYEQ